MTDTPAAPASPDLNSMFAALRAPFPANQISWRVGARSRDKKKGQALPYIDARDVQARLDEVCGPQNWKNSFAELREGILCRLSIKCGEEWVTKEDVAGSDLVTESTAGSDDVNQKRDIAVKGAHSDALKRAGVVWGIGRYLYSFDAPWVELRDEKYFVTQPSLPRHLLPEGDQSTGRPNPAPSSRATDTQRQRPAPSAQAPPAIAPSRPSSVPQSPGAEQARPAQPDVAAAPARATQATAIAISESPQTSTLLGTQEQWDALLDTDRNTVNVLLDRITKGVALHNVNQYLTTGRGKELPEWLRTALNARLDEKNRAAAQSAAAAA